MPENRIMHFQRLPCLQIYVSKHTSTLSLSHTVFKCGVHCAHTHPAHTNCAIVIAMYGITVFDCRSVSFTFAKVTHAIYQKIVCIVIISAAVIFFSLSLSSFHSLCLCISLKYRSLSVKLHCKLICIYMCVYAVYVFPPVAPITICSRYGSSWNGTKNSVELLLDGINAFNWHICDERNGKKEKIVHHVRQRCIV